MLPRLYAIVDASSFSGGTAAVVHFARQLASAGVTLIQLRDKHSSARDVLSRARELRRACPGVKLIMNDRADLCLAAGFDGVHVGQDDISPAAARRVVGDRLWVGVSTHNPAQVAEAAAAPVDYIAVGPVFATSTKLNPDPVIGLDGVRAARALTSRPLVAIGGITRLNARSVLDAGADSVAVISDLSGDPARSAQEFLRVLR